MFKKIVFETVFALIACIYSINTFGMQNDSQSLLNAVARGDTSRVDHNLFLENVRSALLQQKQMQFPELEPRTKVIIEKLKAEQRKPINLYGYNPAADLVKLKIEAENFLKLIKSDILKAENQGNSEQIKQLKYSHYILALEIENTNEAIRDINFACRY